MISTHDTARNETHETFLINTRKRKKEPKKKKNGTKWKGSRSNIRNIFSNIRAWACEFEDKDADDEKKICSAYFFYIFFLTSVEQQKAKKKKKKN